MDIMESAIYVMEQSQPRMKRGITEVIMNTFGMASTRQLDASWQNEQALQSTEKDIIHALAQGERNFKLIEMMRSMIYMQYLDKKKIWNKK